MKGKATIVVTYDDVLEYTSYDLYLYLRSQIVTFSKFLDIYKLQTKKEFYERPRYDILECFGLEKINELYGKENITDIIYLYYLILFQEYYNKNPKFVSLSNIATLGLGNILFNKCSGIENIIVLIKYRTENEKNFKTNIVKKYIDNAKIIYLNFNEDYFSCFKQIKNWNLVITDDPALIEKLASCDIDHAEFLIPEYGYNTLKPELIELIKLKNSSVSTYKIE